MKVTIRPNLNTGKRFGTIEESTVHAGRLGKKLDSCHQVSIRCDSVVLRKSGLALARDKGQKTVHAGLIGERINFREIPEGAPRISYNPHSGDCAFYVRGSVYTGGGIVSGVGHRYFLVED